MNATAPIEIGSLLYVKASPAGGRVCISGSGVSARAVGELHAAGLSPEQIMEQYPHLALPGVYAGIAHYLANHERFEAQSRADEEFAEAITRLFPNGWRGEPLPPHLEEYLQPRLHPL
ncbi:MAG: DUF433 domain-containing protein [Tepidiformaceae bacterium]